MVDKPRLDQTITENKHALSLLAEGPPARCPAYGKECDCPTESAIRRLCERTAANIHR